MLKLFNNDKRLDDLRKGIVEVLDRQTKLSNIVADNLDGMNETVTQILKLIRNHQIAENNSPFKSDWRLKATFDEEKLRGEDVKIELYEAELKQGGWIFKAITETTVPRTRNFDHSLGNAKKFKDAVVEEILAPINLEVASKLLTVQWSYKQSYDDLRQRIEQLNGVKAYEDTFLTKLSTLDQVVQFTRAKQSYSFLEVGVGIDGIYFNMRDRIGLRVMTWNGNVAIAEDTDRYYMPNVSEKDIHALFKEGYYTIQALGTLISLRTGIDYKELSIDRESGTIKWNGRDAIRLFWLGFRVSAR